MTVHAIAVDSLLSVLVLCCWIGSIGAVRMREPMQALHYLFAPTTLGAMCLGAAIWIERGFTQASFKITAIAFLLVAVNSVITHATARMFRIRAAGDWRSGKGISIEHVGEKP